MLICPLSWFECPRWTVTVQSLIQPQSSWQQLASGEFVVLGVGVCCVKLLIYVFCCNCTLVFWCVCRGNLRYNCPIQQALFSLKPKQSESTVNNHRLIYGDPSLKMDLWHWQQLQYYLGNSLQKRLQYSMSCNSKIQLIPHKKYS